MIGGLSFVVSLSMAEIAAALPTAGGIYYVGTEGEIHFLFQTVSDFLPRLFLARSGLNGATANFLRYLVVVQIRWS
jgi:hypothetical protein